MTTVGSCVATAAEKAQWAEGFTAGGALLLIYDDALLGVLDRWVRSLDDTEFLEVAPLLRRSFGGFSPAERGNLLRATRSLSGHAARANAPDIDLSRADGVLTTKAQMMIAGLQRLPQQDLRQGHLPAEAAGGVCLRASHGPNPPSTTRVRRAVPLPVNGEDFHRLHSGYLAAQASLLTSIQDWHEPLARSRTRPM